MQFRTKPELGAAKTEWRAEWRGERARSAVRDWIVRTEHRTSERGAQKSANMAVATAAADAAFLGHITRGNERTRQRGGEREERAASDTRAPRCFLSSGRLPVFLLTYEPFRARKRVNDYGTLSILIHLTGHRCFGRGSILVSLRSIILRNEISRPSIPWIRKKLPLP